MSSTPLPSDSSSLLVPLNMDAWVVDTQVQNKTQLAWYYPDYSNLASFESPMPEPFEVSDPSKPAIGVHLHWALPDALTHARQKGHGSALEHFPLAPNRWLIARFSTASGSWQCRLWVVHSDCVSSLVGSTSVGLSGSITSVPLTAGASQAIAAGVTLTVSGSGVFATVTTAAPVAAGDTQIAVQSVTLASALPPGSTVSLTSMAVGTTGAELSGTFSSIPLAASASQAIGAGVSLNVSGTGPTIVVTTAAAVAPGDAQIAIELFTLPDSYDLPAGSTVSLGSPFLNPLQPSTMDVTLQNGSADGSVSVNTIPVQVGTSYTIDAWEANPDPGTGDLFLTAVGPANVSFAAYVPSVRDVFSFVDGTVPSEGTGTYTYTYLVAGWYSQASADPLSGVSAFDPDHWRSQTEWASQSPADRFKKLLRAMRWSLPGTGQAGESNSEPVIPDPPPSTTLYHALMVDVAWPYSQSGVPSTTGGSVRVAVGNSSADALAALIQYEVKSPPAGSDAAKWLQAGDTLAELVQAAMYDLLDEYGKPGGSVEIAQSIEQAWFGSDPGGTVWEVVSAPPNAAGEQARPAQPSPPQQQALAGYLAALNQSQSQLDADLRQLQWLQANLYMMWWRTGAANGYPPWNVPPGIPSTSWAACLTVMEATPSGVYPALLTQTWCQFCKVEQEKAALPDPADSTKANAWANQSWTYPSDGGTSVDLSALGLKLKANAAPRFWRPNDPVVMISGAGRARKHGEDGRYNPDGTLTCRLPGQTITGIQLTTTQSVTAQNLAAAAIDLNPAAGYTSVPGIPSLLAEAFLADPLNAPAMASAISNAVDAQTIQQSITALISGTATTASWLGTPPVPFAIQLWKQAWSPLFLEWQARYYPTVMADNSSAAFSLGNWSFDGTKYNWNGTGIYSDRSIQYQGRTLLTPHAVHWFKDKIQKYLAKHSRLDTQELKDFIETVAGWDLLSQSLSGFTDQLITLDTQETFPPPPDPAAQVTCPQASGAATPSVTALVGQQYHNIPLLDGGAADFYPVRGGLVQFPPVSSQPEEVPPPTLQIVDAFGQVLGLDPPNTTQGFQPILGRGLTPPNPPPSLYGCFQLPPRLIQSARLDMQWLANDGSGLEIDQSPGGNAICGWLLPNHLDGAIAVYDSSGLLLGEVWPASGWKARPGGNAVPVTNPILQQVIDSLKAQSSQVLSDFLTTVDETLWMVDPMGGRKDQFLSVLIGRPLAVVQMRLQLTLNGSPWFNQRWSSVLQQAQSGSPYQWVQDTGGVDQMSFPVRLGNLDLRDDGLIGYFPAGGTPPSVFYAVHRPQEINQDDTYIQKIGAGNFISLQPQGDAVTLTLLVDPRGSVHAETGVLPVTKAALPAHAVEEFLKTLQVTFQTGPILAETGTLRIPMPAEEHGTWNWIQPVGSGWQQSTFVDTDGQARLPDGSPQLQEGWLQLSGVGQSK